MAYQDVVLADAPAGYWRLDETFGDTMNDLSGNARHGTYSALRVVNQPGAIAGNACVSFGGNAYASVPDNAAFAPTAITVEAWVYAAGTWNSSGIINRRTAGNVGGFTLECAGNMVFYVYTTAFVPCSAPAPTLGYWHHVVGVYASGRHEVWIDGVLAGTAATAGALNNPAGALLEIGRNVANTGLMFPGSLDEVAIYGTALSPRRIRAHYAASGRGYREMMLSDGPFGYWRLGEPSGTAIADSSPYALHGTASGLTLAQPGALANDPDTAASFVPASSSYVAVPQSTYFNTGAGGWTVECWAYVRNLPTAGDAPCFFASNYPGGGDGHIPMVLGFDFSTNRPMVAYHHGTNGWTQCVSPTQLPLNQWVHLAGTFNGTTTLRLYLNAMQIAAKTDCVTLNAMPSASPRYIGRRWDQPFCIDGVIDEVACYHFEMAPNRLLARVALGNPYRGAVIVDAPRGYWPLNEASGTVVNDNSNGALNGSYLGSGHAYAQASGIRGSPSHGVANANFNGTGPYIDLGYGAPFANPAAFTMEAWVWSAAPTAQNEGAQIIGCHNNANRGYTVLMDARAGSTQPFKLHYRMLDSAQVVQGVKTYALRAWHHIVATYDGTTYRLYGDGVLDASAARTAGPGDCTVDNHFCIASVAVGWGGPAGYNGRIDECAYYTYALSPERVLAHYEAGLDNPLKRWSGSAWLMPGVQRWDGSNWVTPVVKRWDGTAWV
jgi:hypothetical protein